MKLLCEIDATQFNRIAKRVMRGNQKALESAMRSEGYRLKEMMTEYIRNWGEGSWPPAAPISIALRKSRDEVWLARFVRYWVSRGRNGLSLRVGIFRGIRAKAFQAPSATVVKVARKFVRGRRVKVTRKSQMILAKMLRAKGIEDVRRYLPKVGRHIQPPRSYVEPVREREYAKTIRNIMTLYQMKLAGIRYSDDWWKTWGNEPV